MNFEGHACKIGAEEINERLSLRRARAFTEAFKERLKNNYPGSYQEIWARIDEPLGFGENVPLVIKTKEFGEVILGDNELPTGRYLNRRIMVLLYREN